MVMNQGHSINTTNITPQQAIKRRRIFEDDDNDAERAREARKFFENDSHETDPVPLILRGSHVKVIASTNPYVLKKGLNTTTRFQEFQRAAIQKYNTVGLILETHPCHVFSLSFILLLKPKQYSDDMPAYFTSDKLDQVRINVLKKFRGEEYETMAVEMTLKMKIVGIIEVNLLYANLFIYPILNVVY
jgi:hypothetical protein